MGTWQRSNITLNSEKIFFIKETKSSSIVLGVDEAGRGPVIGPMVIACYGIEPIKTLDLLNLGVDDSKKLSVSKREELYNTLIDIASLVRIAIIPPKIIDKWVAKGNGLNELEALMIAKLCRGIVNEITSLFIDSPSNPESFGKYLKKYGLGKFKAENKADSSRPVVAAASIIAKVLRDRIIKLLKKIIGIDFGSGYPSDPKTRRLIPVLLKKYPLLVRKSWNLKK